MDAVFVKTVPARAFAFDALQIPFTIELSTTVEHVMLSRNVKDVLCPAALQHLIESVELFRLRQLRNISRMNEEGWARWHRIDAIKSNFEGCSDIFIRLFTEADMTVADLQKAKVGSR